MLASTARISSREGTGRLARARSALTLSKTACNRGAASGCLSVRMETPSIGAGVTSRTRAVRPAARDVSTLSMKFVSSNGSAVKAAAVQRSGDDLT